MIVGEVQIKKMMMMVDYKSKDNDKKGSSNYNIKNDNKGDDGWGSDNNENKNDNFKSENDGW